jgi:hypothetical protein
MQHLGPRAFRGATTSRRERVRILPGLLLIALACIACDPFVGVSARNESDQALVVREGAEQWSLPAHGSGRVFSQLGSPESEPPRDYEILDAATCVVLATEHVDFSARAYPEIVVRADRSLVVGSPAPDTGNLETTTACPGPDRGWSLWIVNHTATSMFIRSTSPDGYRQVAAALPNQTYLGLGGYDEMTTVELLDQGCRVLDTHTRTGWGDFTATIDGTHFTISIGAASSIPEVPSRGTQCK